jgi:hypothetical protein
MPNAAKGSGDAGVPPSPNGNAQQPGLVSLRGASATCRIHLLFQRSRANLPSTFLARGLSSSGPQTSVFKVGDRGKGEFDCTANHIAFAL